jgi:N6-adenosine-specific RNA methylase IME4
MMLHSLLAHANGPYELFHVDPPWKFKDSANSGKRGAVHKYPVMTVPELCALPVGDLAAKNALLAMWTVPTMPEEALCVMRAWGFRFVTLKGFTWVKTTRNGKLHFGMGHYTRSNSEDCAFAVKGKWTELCASHAVSQIIYAPVREHSRKPDEAADKLVQLCGDVSRIELFARNRRPGWDAWGNETPRTIEEIHTACLRDHISRVLTR